MIRFKNFIIKGINMIFFGVFVVIVFIILLNFQHENLQENILVTYNHKVTILFVIILIGLIFYVNRILTLNLKLFKKIKWYFYIFYSILVLNIQLYLASALAIEGAGDVYQVFKGAESIFKYGNLNLDLYYFSTYPNNIPLSLFVGVLFKIFSVLKFTDTNFWLTIINIVFVDTGLCFILLICKKLGGLKSLFLAMFIVLIYIPWHFYLPVFYTDTISFPFLMSGYYSYLMYKDAYKLKRILFLLLFIILITFGTIIKVTTGLIIFAVIVDAILKNNHRNNLKDTIFSIIIIIFSIAFLNNYIIGKVISKDLLIKNKLPLTHWIMMGLKDYGGYNTSDEDLTISFGEYSKKVQGNLIVINERIHNIGIPGLPKFISNKVYFILGDGTFNVASMLDDFPINTTKIHEFVSYQGKNFVFFSHICIALNLALFIIFIPVNFFNKRSIKRNFKLIIPKLSLLFAIGFFILWEANPRLMLNYSSMYIILTTLNLNENIKLYKVIFKRLDFRKGL